MLSQQHLVCVWIIIALFAGVKSQIRNPKLLPTDSMAQDIVEDPENGCIYIIFRERIAMHCRNTTNHVEYQLIADETTLNGELIVGWVPRVDFYGHLFFFSQRITDGTPSLCRMAVTRSAREPDTAFPRYTRVGNSTHLTICGEQSANLKRAPIYYVLDNLLQRLYTISIIDFRSVSLSQWDIMGPKSFAHTPRGIFAEAPSFAYVDNMIVYATSTGTIVRYFPSNGTSLLTASELGRNNTYGPWKASATEAHVLRCNSAYSCDLLSFSETATLSVVVTLTGNPFEFLSFEGKSVILENSSGNVTGREWTPNLPVTDSLPVATSFEEIAIMDENFDRRPIFLTIDGNVSTTLSDWKSRYSIEGDEVSSARVTRDYAWLLRRVGNSQHSVTRIERSSIFPTPIDIIDVPRPQLCSGLPTLPYGKTLGIVAKDLSNNVTALVVNRGSSTSLIYVINSIVTAWSEFRLPTFSGSTNMSFVSSRLVAKINDTDLLLELSTPYYVLPLLALLRIDSVTGLFTWRLVVGPNNCQVPLRVSNYAVSPNGAYVLVSYSPSFGVSHKVRLINVAANQISDPLADDASNELLFSPSEISNMVARNQRLPAVFFSDGTSVTVLFRDFATAQALVFSLDTLSSRAIPTSCTLSIPLVFGVGKSPLGDRFVVAEGTNPTSLCIIDFNGNLSRIDIFGSGQWMNASSAGDIADLRFLTLGDGSIVGFYANTLNNSIVIRASQQASTGVSLSSGLFSAFDVGARETTSDFLLLSGNSTDTNFDIFNCTNTFSCTRITTIQCSGICRGSPRILASSSMSAVLHIAPDLPIVLVYLNASSAPRDGELISSGVLKVAALSSSDTFVILTHKNYSIVQMTSVGPFSRGGGSYQRSMLDPYFGTGGDHETITSPSGATRILMNANEASDWLGRSGQQALIFPQVLCVANANCGPSGQCNSTSGTCNILTSEGEEPFGAPPSSFLPSTPAPVLSPLTQGCPPPQPSNAVCTAQGWVIQGNVTVPEGSTVVVPGGTVTVNGSLQLSSNSTLVFVASGTLNVTGCVRPDGTLVAEVPGSQQSQSGVIELIAFGGGYCDGEKREFTNATIRSIGPGDACASLRSSVAYGERSIGVLYSYDFASCAPQDASAAALSAGAIAGIVIAAIVVVGLVIAFVLFVSFRNRVAPYSGHDSKHSTKDHELE